MGMLMQAATIEGGGMAEHRHHERPRSTIIQGRPGPRHVIHSSSGPQNNKLTFKCAEEKQEGWWRGDQFDIKVNDIKELWQSRVPTRYT